MKMRKKNGFTLIELLAVIVILSVIALIAVPIILGIIEKIQVASYKQSLRSVFSATDLYIATSEFGDIPSDGINITDENIKLKNKTFTSGKIIKNEEGKIELNKVSDGYYCGNGTLDNLIVIEGSCDSLDETPPTITIGSSTVTSNSITIVATAEDLESGINSYEFSNDNGSTWTSRQTSNVYAFNNLTNNTGYTFKVRVYNNNFLSTESNVLEVTTNNIPLPTYSIDNSNWTQSAVVTITYPERQSEYIYEYSLDEGSTWEEVVSPNITKDITFSSNGNVIARISDGTNIVSGATYEVTNIDITPPVITVNPETIIVMTGSTYNDTGITAIDNEEGDITARIVTTGTVDTSNTGTYALTYNVTDTAGNAADEVTRTVDVIEAVYTFNYTGAAQTFTIPLTGTYQIELWGASGGDEGLGGYTKGNISLTEGEILNIYVGGQGVQTSGGWNGGGNGVNKGTAASYGGGGATDIRLTSGNWNDSTSLRSRIMVAAGGGGSNDIQGSSGGGLTGTNGYSATYSSYQGRGATQTSGGGVPSFYSCNGTNGKAGVFGAGGNGGVSGTNGGGGGGGAGYYGGSGASGLCSGAWNGGGGSSFISGHTGCNAINSSGSHTGQPNHYSGYIFTNTETQSGIWIGNGQAKVTFISP